MSVVVDASIAVKWVIPESDQAQALVLRDSLRETKEELLVPPIFIPEIINVLYQQVRKGVFTLDQARRAFGFLDKAVYVQEHPSLADEAMEFAALTGLTAAYDAFYLALAHATRCRLWTADRPMARAATAVGIDAHSLDEF